MAKRLLVIALIGGLIGSGAYYFFCLRPHHSEIQVQAFEPTIKPSTQTIPYEGSTVEYSALQADNTQLVQTLALEFVTSIRQKNLNRIAQYWAFDDGSVSDPFQALDPLDYQFLYGGDLMGNAKPVLEIIGSGELGIKAIDLKNDTYYVLFYPIEIAHEIDAVNYQEKNWMDTFFSCLFKMHDGKLVLDENFCFNETDGPYEGDDY